MELLYRGAEADIFVGEWADSEAVYKYRKPLPYRLPILDAEIRAQRTVREAEMISDVKAGGVRSPYLYYVSPKESLIVMEKVEGTRLKSFLEEEGVAVREVGSEFGAAVGRLHRAGFIHGDLTTSNVIIAEDGIRLIDFGLAAHSVRLEDHAVDLRLIKETLVGAHSSLAQRMMASFLEGYSGEVGERRGAEVTKKLAEIERRGRYARVE